MFTKVDLKVPKKYQEYFDRLEAEAGLIDDCKYMLYLKSGYALWGEFSCFPVKSKKEALEFLKQVEKEKNYDELKEKGLI